MTDRILVNDRCLYRPGAGVRVYLHSLMQHWPKDGPIKLVGFCTERKTFFQGFGSRKRAPSAPGKVTFQWLSHLNPSSAVPSRYPKWVRRAAENFYSQSFGRELTRGEYAGYFEPNHVAIRCPDRLTVTMVHDLSVLEHPEWHPKDRVALWHRDFKLTQLRTTHWIVPSRFTRERMMSVLSVPSQKISVIPEAARPLPYPHPDHVHVTRLEMGLPERYLLHLGTLEPRKNLKVLLDAYAALSPDFRRAYPLILAGAPGWGDVAFWKSLIEHRVAGEVLWTGYVSDRLAAAMLAGAAAVLVPSVYEGFGLPILEGMACGTPVICSSTAAFREVAHEAAELVDPTDVLGWSRAIRRLGEDMTWAERRKKTGPKRNADFSWEKAAKEHARVMAEVLARQTAKV